MIKKDLMDKAKINATTMSNMGKGKPVSLETLGRICLVLNCNIGDIVDFIKD
jgi:DNA-binding Xre family transcriptional regulator